MTRGEAVGLIVASFVATLSFGLTALGWFITRRVAAWTTTLTRLSAVEGKLSVLDVAGTQGNKHAIDELRRDIDNLEALHRRDLIDVDRRIVSQSLTMAQLAERLNSYTWGRRSDRHRDEDRPPSGNT